MENPKQKSTRLLLLSFWGLILLLPCARAQEVVAAQGGFVATGSLWYTFTVGESFISTVSNTAVLVTQGFHQPEFVTVSVQTPSDRFQLRAFPNPTADALTVSYDGEVQRFDLFDGSGRLLSTRMPIDSERSFDLFCTGFPAGLYLLRAVGSSGETVGFVRIVKL